MKQQLEQAGFKEFAMSNGDIIPNYLFIVANGKSIGVFTDSGNVYLDTYRIMSGATPEEIINLLTALS